MGVLIEGHASHKGYVGGCTASLYQCTVGPASAGIDNTDPRTRLVVEPVIGASTNSETAELQGVRLQIALNTEVGRNSGPNLTERNARQGERKDQRQREYCWSQNETSLTI